MKLLKPPGKVAKGFFFKQITIQETEEERQQSADPASVFEKELQAVSFHLSKSKAERWKWNHSLVEPEALWGFFHCFYSCFISLKVK